MTMVKLVFLCRRRPDITHAAYVARLLEGHVPLALRHHPTMRRYLVNVVEEARAGAPPLDSVGMLWFDSLADYRERLYDSEEGARIVARDVAGFLGSADAYVTVEDEPSPGAKRAGERLLLCVERDAAAEELAWRRLAAGPGCVVSRVQERFAPGAPDYAGMVELPGRELPAENALRAHAYAVRAHVARWG